MDVLDIVLNTAKKHGIDEALIIYTTKIETKDWLLLKCKYGCRHYSKNHACPPYAITPDDMRKLLREYKRAVLVIGKDNGKQDSISFKKAVLDIENSLLLNNFNKAMAMTTGPCIGCEECLHTEHCPFPEQKRPSLEGVGIDIVATVKKFKRNIDFQVQSQPFPSFGLILLD